MRCWTLLVCLVAAGGCGGHYIITAGDQVAGAGQQAAVVSRIQRNELFVLSLPVSDAAMRYVLPGVMERGAYSDEAGYAGVAIDAPDEPGMYSISIVHCDPQGREAARVVDLYVLAGDRPAVAVELDGLPKGGGEPAAEASASLRRLALTSEILYFTRSPVNRHSKARQALAQAGYPDGPILAWRAEGWRIELSRYGMPQVVVQPRPVGQMEGLRERLGQLYAGVCTSPAAADAFLAAGLQCVVVGGADVGDRPVTRVSEWRYLDRAGLE